VRVPLAVLRAITDTKDMFTNRIAIDLGTVNTLVYLPRKGITINEPSVVALNSDNDEIVAIGQDAREMLGRTPEALLSHEPMRDGVIADFRVTREMLKHYINLSIGRFRLVKPDVMICVPVGATSTERKAVIDATLAAGTRSVHVISEPVAAALGAGVPITDPIGNMVIDIGGGTTEIAVISLGGVVAESSVRVGGNKLNAAISEHIRKVHNLAIGEQTAENIKQKIARAMQPDEPSTMMVDGRDIIGGLPKKVEVSDRELVEPLQEVLEKVLFAVRHVLEQTPPELVSDISQRGIVLTGGSAQLKDLDKLLKKIINVPIIIADDPELCVVNGAGAALENLAEYKRSLLTYHS